MPAIAEATKGKTLDANSNRGPLVVWSVKLDDGRTAELLRKPESAAPTGDVTVEDGPHGLKAKLVQQGGGKDFKADPKGLRGKNASMAVAYAKDLVIAEKIELGQLSLYAGKFYDFIESKAKVGE